MIDLAIARETAVPTTHVIVQFGAGIPADAQGVALLNLEKFLRNLGVAAEVYKETKPDDSKLRLSMTEEKRKRL